MRRTFPKKKSVRRAVQQTARLLGKIKSPVTSDGKSIHVFSAYGNKSAPYDLGANILLVRKLLSELARDPGSGDFKDLQQQKDEQGQPTQKPYVGGQAGWGSSGGPGTNP